MACVYAKRLRASSYRPHFNSFCGLCKKRQQDKELFIGGEKERGWLGPHWRLERTQISSILFHISLASIHGPFEPGRPLPLESRVGSTRDGRLDHYRDG